MDYITTTGTAYTWHFAAPALASPGTHDPESGPGWCDGCRVLWWEASAERNRSGARDAMTHTLREAYEQSVRTAEEQARSPNPTLAPASACPRHALASEFRRLRDQARGASVEAVQLADAFAEQRERLRALPAWRDEPAPEPARSWSGVLALLAGLVAALSGALALWGGVAP